MHKSQQTATKSPKAPPKREPNGNRSIALAYIQSQCGAIFRRGFSLAAHREKLYVRASGTKIPLYLDLSAQWQEVQRRAGELQAELQKGPYDPEEWRLQICGHARVSSAMTLSELEAFWRRRKEAEGILEKTYEHDYGRALQRLNQKRPLSTSSLMEAISQIPPGTTRRTRNVRFYRQLAEASGHPWNGALLDPLQMSGYRTKKRAISIFTDEEIKQIIETSRRSDQPGWWRVFALLSIYGLRPWEAWYAEPSSRHKGCVWIPIGKRNSKGSNPPREVPPFHRHWLEEFDMEQAWKQPLPHLKEKSDSGSTVCNRLRWGHGFKWGTGKSAYGFRNAYARRIHTTDYRVTDGDGAAFMGHTVMVHNSVYRQWIDGYEDPIARYL